MLHGLAETTDTLPRLESETSGEKSPVAAMVRLVDVVKRFGAHPAIDGISLEVRPGEVVGVIGRSGAGKSTLIRCLNGLEKPDSGRVEILGQDIAPLAERDLRAVRGARPHRHDLSALQPAVLENCGRQCRASPENRGMAA